MEFEVGLGVGWALGVGVGLTLGLGLGVGVRGGRGIGGWGSRWGGGWGWVGGFGWGGHGEKQVAERGVGLMLGWPPSYLHDGVLVWRVAHGVCGI